MADVSCQSMFKSLDSHHFDTFFHMQICRFLAVVPRPLQSPVCLIVVALEMILFCAACDFVAFGNNGCDGVHVLFIDCCSSSVATVGSFVWSK